MAPFARRRAPIYVSRPFLALFELRCRSFVLLARRVQFSTAFFADCRYNGPSDRRCQSMRQWAAAFYAPSSLSST